jgi:hypothetical protein
VADELPDVFIAEAPIGPDSRLHCVVDTRVGGQCTGFAELGGWYTAFYDRDLHRIAFYEVGIESTIGPVELLLGGGLVRAGLARLGAWVFSTGGRAAVTALGLRVAITMAPAVDRLRMLYLTLAGSSAVVTGIHGSIPRTVLDTAMRASGPTLQVFTRLTQSPQVDRALSVGVGQAGQALATAARGTGRVYVARIPEVLIRQMEAVGLATRSQTLMNGVVGTEIEFTAAASRWIVPFFHGM